jgi:hypothetical protein
MISQKFIELYDKSEKTFDFDYFFKNFYENQSPVKPIKQKVKCNIPNENILKILCDSILGNLFLNPGFKSTIKEVNLDDLKPLYELVKAVNNDKNDASFLPKLILYLHMSKCNFGFLQGIIFFIQIDSVHICNEEERAKYWFAAELDNTFSKIVNNNQIKFIAIDVVKIITNSKYIDYDFSKLQLKYFKSVIINLNGYAGINTVYISIYYLSCFYEYLTRLNVSEKLTILKLNFFRIVLHEMTHVILRNSLNDMNDSTPGVIKRSKIQLTAANNNEIFEEAGIISENKMFGGRINWIDSVKQDNFNIEYCNNVLKKLEQNISVTFDDNEAHTVKYTHQPGLMSMDESPFPDIVFE